MKVREVFHSRNRGNESKSLILADNDIVVPKIPTQRQQQERGVFVNKVSQIKRRLLRLLYTLDMNLVVAYFILSSVGVVILAILLKAYT